MPQRHVLHIRVWQAVPMRDGSWLDSIPTYTQLRTERLSNSTGTINTTTADSIYYTGDSPTTYPSNSSCITVPEAYCGRIRTYILRSLGHHIGTPCKGLRSITRGFLLHLYQGIGYTQQGYSGHERATLDATDGTPTASPLGEAVNFVDLNYLDTLQSVAPT